MTWLIYPVHKLIIDSYNVQWSSFEIMFVQWPSFKCIHVECSGFEIHVYLDQLNICFVYYSPLARSNSYDPSFVNKMKNSVSTSVILFGRRTDMMVFDDNSRGSVLGRFG